MYINNIDNFEILMYIFLELNESMLNFNTLLRLSNLESIFYTVLIKILFQ